VLFTNDVQVKMHNLQEKSFKCSKMVIKV